MLRRAHSELRVLLLVVAIALLLWLSLSYFFAAWLTARWPPVEVTIASSDGVFFLMLDNTLPPHASPGMSLDFRPGHTLIWDSVSRVVPSVHQIAVGTQSVNYVFVPLWLLAAICLAWPTTSFIVARRRRRGRGFEVEATAGGAVSMADD